MAARRTAFRNPGIDGRRADQISRIRVERAGDRGPLASGAKPEQISAGADPANRETPDRRTFRGMGRSGHSRPFIRR
jgi:hypothetical protein